MKYTNKYLRSNWKYAPTNFYNCILVANCFWNQCFSEYFWHRFSHLAGCREISRDLIYHFEWRHPLQKYGIFGCLRNLEELCLAFHLFQPTVSCWWLYNGREAQWWLISCSTYIGDGTRSVVACGCITRRPIERYHANPPVTKTDWLLLSRHFSSIVYSITVTS